jgi:hypothetical protein
MPHPITVQEGSIRYAMDAALGTLTAADTNNHNEIATAVNSLLGGATAITVVVEEETIRTVKEGPGVTTAGEAEGAGDSDGMGTTHEGGVLKNLQINNLISVITAHNPLSSPFTCLRDG